MQSLREIGEDLTTTEQRTHFPTGTFGAFLPGSWSCRWQPQSRLLLQWPQPLHCGSSWSSILGGHHVSLQPGISRGAQRSASGVVSCWHTGPYLSRLKGLLPNLRAPASTKTSNKAGLAQLTSLSPVQSGLRAPRERQKGAGVPKPEKTPCKNLKLYRESEEVIL